MEISFKKNEEIYNINLNKNAIFFGQNNTYKNNFINTLIDVFNGKNKSLLINGLAQNLDDFNVIFISEDNDFAKEFKFTKGNALKNLIYNDIVKKINEEKIINYANEIFDSIDEKVNKLLDRKINKKSNNNLSLQIEIPDLNSIIDKFTNIYVDDLLLNNSDISKAMKRKLLYQLYFLDIKNNCDKTNIVIINNFDVYLNSNEIIEVLNSINELSNENCHFILSSSSNIFEYISLSSFAIYKINNHLLSLNVLDLAIKNYIIKRNFIGETQNFEDFYIKNEGLIEKEEILNIKSILFSKYPILLSKILNSSNIKICLEKPKTISCDYIVAESKDLKILLEEICKYFID